MFAELQFLLIVVVLSSVIYFIDCMYISVLPSCVTINKSKATTRHTHWGPQAQLPGFMLAMHVNSCLQKNLILLKKYKH